MSNYSISIRPYGVHTVLVEWPNKVEEAILDDILLFMRHLRTNCLDETFWEMIPAYNSLTLLYRKDPIDFLAFSQTLHDWYSNKEEAVLPQKYLWKLPVCYDLDFGIDLKEISDVLDLSIENIIALHTKSPYTVYGIGFLPGFMYLGGLPKELEVPRKAQPRARVQKGAVGLASRQTGIYPQISPGGWNIIGNCSVAMFDASKENPCFVNIGDKVQFYAIERAEYDLHKIEGEVGIYKLEKENWYA
ncbi:5-oxoprolinase subunit PxpB [uncultured Kriegella sp.]|uniref:5-oxoprolinase subunit PxpB n=1 Tax=uncultured Kriegella sp. TaxID=1798910 RepID=UPI0030D8E4D5